MEHLADECDAARSGGVVLGETARRCLPQEFAARPICPVGEVGESELTEIVRWVAKVDAKIETADSAAFLRERRAAKRAGAQD